jgi:hypothetical protein
MGLISFYEADDYMDVFGNDILHPFPVIISAFLPNGQGKNHSQPLAKRRWEHGKMRIVFEHLRGQLQAWIATLLQPLRQRLHIGHKLEGRGNDRKFRSQ